MVLITGKDDSRCEEGTFRVIQLQMFACQWEKKSAEGPLLDQRF